MYNEKEKDRRAGASSRQEGRGAGALRQAPSWGGTGRTGQRPSLLEHGASGRERVASSKIQAGSVHQDSIGSEGMSGLHPSGNGKLLAHFKQESDIIE